MGTYDSIQVPVPGQPISSSLYGIRVRDAIINLDTRATTIETQAQAIIARGRRITQKLNADATVSATEVSYFRLDNVPVRAGTAYRIMTSGINLDSSVGSDVMIARLRIQYSATTGTVATTSSTQSGEMRTGQINSAQSDVVPMSAFYYATATGFISLLLTHQRVAGTGVTQWYASATEMMDLTVEYAGIDPGDTGVSL